MESHLGPGYSMGAILPILPGSWGENVTETEQPAP